MADQTIPAEWQQLHWKKQVILAEEISGKTDLESGEARAIIESEARRQATEARKPAAVDPSPFGGKGDHDNNGTVGGAKAPVAPTPEEIATAETVAAEKLAVRAPQTVPIRLLRDTWQGETRIRADGRVTYWPIEDAKRLLANRVAERADPLPGA